MSADAEDKANTESDDSSGAATPLISVITVVRNAPDAVAKTIRSVAKQTGNIEHLLIDGASTDNTLETIRQHANSRCRVISEPDRGIYDAMNKGVLLARGEWLIFMNAGDTFHRDSVTSDVSLHLGSGRDVLLGETIVKLSDSLETRCFHAFPKPPVEWWKGLPACHQSIFYRRERLLQLTFDLQYFWCADFDQFARLVNGGASVATLPFIVSVYDGNGADHRNPNIYIRERRKISRQLRSGVVQKVYFANESLRLRISGPILSALKRIMPGRFLIKIRRLRRTGGVPAETAE